MKLKFTIPGEPKGKGRPRMTKTGHTYTPDDTAMYENLVRLEYQRQCGTRKFPEDAMIDARITAYYSIPKSVSKKKRGLMLDHKLRPCKKPDCDNCIKIVLDSLNSIAYKDDVQIVDCQIRKFYSDDPRVVVTLQEASST